LVDFSQLLSTCIEDKACIDGHFGYVLAGDITQQMFSSMQQSNNLIRYLFPISYFLLFSIGAECIKLSDGYLKNIFGNYFL